MRTVDYRLPLLLSPFLNNTDLLLKVCLYFVPVFSLPLYRVSGPEGQPNPSQESVHVCLCACVIAWFSNVIEGHFI